MSDENMVERVAKAIWIARNQGEPQISYDDFLPSQKDGECKLARAAILAMREPTAAMRIAVGANWGRRTWAEYQTVIDAASFRAPPPSEGT